MDDTPDITVELAERPSVLAEATVAGAVAGGLLLAAVEFGAGSVVAIGYPHVFDGGPATVESLFHGLFAVIFGSGFGLLVDARPAWRYGRGFLGPLVGVAFGVVLWGLQTGAYGLFGLVSPGFAFDAVPLALALASYVAYGAVVGIVMNGLGLLQA